MSVTNLKRIAESNRDMEVHRAFAKWIEEETGFLVDAKALQLSQRLYDLFRANGSYHEAKQLQRDNTAAEAAAAKERAVGRLNDRLAKLQAEQDAVRAKLPAKPAPVKRGARKPVAAAETLTAPTPIHKRAVKKAAASARRTRLAASAAAAKSPDQF